MSTKPSNRRTTPAQVIVVGFAGTILLGAILLNLPISSTSGQCIGFLDALFSSTSAVCVTGLSVIEVGTTLTLFGQIVLLCLIQIGGLGFMITASFIYMLIGKRITLKERMVLQESLNESHLQGIVRMARNVLLVTLIAECIGMLLLMIRFIPEYGAAQGFYYSVFHSISAFCNAGFDVFGLGNSLVSFANDPLVCWTIMGLIVVGGIGFFVIMELFRASREPGKQHHFSTHTKIVIATTALLILSGFALFFIVEYNNPKTLGSLPTGSKITAAFFESITTRTAGYATINQGDMMPVSKFAAIILMFIGASPAGTGGGIKTTTIAAVFMLTLAIIRGQEDVTVMKKRLNREVALRAVAITFLGFAFVGILTAALAIAETKSIEIGDLLFELVSAFGTVGLSVGITPHLNAASKIILIVAMFVGRVGLLTITIAIANRLQDKMQKKIKYPEDKIMVG